MTKNIFGSMKQASSKKKRKKTWRTVQSSSGESVGQWRHSVYTLLGVSLMVLFTYSLAMPPPGPQTATNDVANFMNSLQGFVGEVSGVLMRRESHDAFTHLSITGLAYLDSLNTLNIRLSMHISHEDAELLMRIQEALGNTVSVLEELAQMQFEEYEGDNQDPQEIESMDVRPVGRQRIKIGRDQIELLRSIGYSWTNIADTLGVSPRTLRNRRHEFGMAVGNGTYDDLNDGQIDEIITDILRVTPRAGQSMIAGAVRQRGLFLQRYRIRESIQRVNPAATALRRRYHIRRRRYNVDQPNALWHADGNHKLISWRIVVHGCIDGYSRAIVYLQCSDNNRAKTVLQAFISGVQSFGIPQRLRTDYGTENFDIALYMLENRGVGRGSVIAGRSVHNQRIERLWRDVNVAVQSTFRDIFHYMENIGILERDCESHLYALHFVYIPRINQALQQFSEMWNHHILRTAGQSPLQLFYGRAIADDIFIDVGELDYLGIDEDGVAVADMQTNNNVHVPRVHFNVSEEDLHYLQTNVDPLANDNNNGINIYMNVVDYISRH